MDRDSVIVGVHHGASGAGDGAEGPVGDGAFYAANVYSGVFIEGRASDDDSLATFFRADVGGDTSDVELGSEGNRAGTSTAIRGLHTDGMGTSGEVTVDGADEGSAGGGELDASSAANGGGARSKVGTSDGNDGATATSRGRDAGDGGDTASGGSEGCRRSSAGSTNGNDNSTAEVARVGGAGDLGISTGEGRTEVVASNLNGGTSGGDAEASAGDDQGRATEVTRGCGRQSGDGQRDSDSVRRGGGTTAGVRDDRVVGATVGIGEHACHLGGGAGDGYALGATEHRVG